MLSVNLIVGHWYPWQTALSHYTLRQCAPFQCTPKTICYGDSRSIGLNGDMSWRKYAQRQTAKRQNKHKICSKVRKIKQSQVLLDTFYLDPFIFIVFIFSLMEPYWIRDPIGSCRTMVDQTSYREPHGIPIYAFSPAFHEKSRFLSKTQTESRLLSKTGTLSRPISPTPDQSQIRT